MSGVAVPLLLTACGIFYCFRLRFFHIIKLPKVMKVLTTRGEAGGTSPLKAVTLALAGTLGVGNIVGVSSAIALGGFGAVFWMWVSALVAMLIKYAEIVLAMLYRRFDSEGAPHGSAMYYIRACFERLHLRRMGKIVAAVFASLCLVNAFTMGSLVQMNAVGEAVEGVFGISPLLTCGALSLLALAVILRGRGGILKFTEVIVPIMTAGYIVVSIAVLIIRADRVGEAFTLIFKNAFSASSASAGVLGFLTSRAIRFGVMRGVISNEAGCGTAPAAHAVSNAKSPARQGVWGIFEVFTDTIVLCTMTALVVIVGYDAASVYTEDFMMMTISAYGSALGNFASVFLALAVLFFGFATVICWAHYGAECASYFSKSQRVGGKGFSAAYCIFAFLGAFISTDTIWQITDFAIGAMTLINLAVLFMMSGEVKRETELFFGSGKNK